MHQNASGVHETASAVSEGHAGACAHCGAGFVPRTKWQRFCSDTCRAKFNKEKVSLAELSKRLKALEERVAYLEQLAMPVR